jgi:hypothetical protein
MVTFNLSEACTSGSLPSQQQTEVVQMVYKSCSEYLPAKKKGLLISTQWILMSKVLPKFVSGRLRGVNSVVRVWPCHFKGRTSNLVGDSCKVTIGYTLTDNNFPLPRFRKKKSASSPRFLCHASKFKINGRGEITKNASIQSILHDINTIWL